MTFTFDRTSISTDLAKVRATVGDVQDMGVNASLSDEEIAWVLTDYTDIRQASVVCCELLIARLRVHVDQNQKGVSSQASRKLDQCERVLKMLKARVKNSGINCYSGQISQDRLDDAKDDTDYPNPSFEIGMDDYPGTGTEDELKGDD